MHHSPIHAMVFDAFGTVFDVCGSLARALSALDNDSSVDWYEFAYAWGNAYRVGVAHVRHTGDWRPVTRIVREHLLSALAREKLRLDGDFVTRCLNLWTQLQPWPDVVRGMRRLQRACPLAALSNGDATLLQELAAQQKIPWDAILSADMVQRYKPDPAMYQLALDHFKLPAERVLLVACHKYDLRAAQALGFRTAFVVRPGEHGPFQTHDLPEPTDADEFDFTVRSFYELAERIGV